MSTPATLLQKQLLTAMLLLMLVACSSAPQPQAHLVAATASPPADSQPTTRATQGPTPLPTFTPIPTPVPGGLFVDPTKPLGPVSPFSFGSNIGPWTGIPLDMQDEIKAAHLTFMRFPGGNWGDDNDLRDYMIDPYIALCREYGFEPAISVRLLGSTPAQAAEVVRYVNITKGYTVRYWSIGNEPSLYATSRKIEGYDTERYNQEWRAFAEAMRAVDPTIILVGPDIHQFDPTGGPRDSAGRFWMREFLLANGDLVDIVAFHRYPFPASLSNPQPTIEQLRSNSPEWDTIIPTLRSLIRETTGRDIPIAVTEINANWTAAARGEGTPDSFSGAIWWADVLTRLIRQRVEIVAHFAIHGPRREGWGLVEKYKVRPAYYIYLLYQQFGDELIYASSDDPLVSIVAAQRNDGMVTVMIVNRADEERIHPLQFVGVGPVDKAETWRFDRQHQAVQLDPTLLTEPLRLPPESVTLLIIPDALGSASQRS